MCPLMTCSRFGRNYPELDANSIPDSFRFVLFATAVIIDPGRGEAARGGCLLDGDGFGEGAGGRAICSYL